MLHSILYVAINCELFLAVRGFVDDLKLVLSKPDLFKTLLTVMERYEGSASEDQTSLMNSMADLIVLLLTGGEKLNLSLAVALVC